MHGLLNKLGTLAGLLGMAVCFVAAMTRLMGSYHLAQYEATSLFVGGTGLMVFACLLKLEALLRKDG